MQEWDMRLSNDLISVDARIQKPVAINLGDRIPFEYSHNNADWSNAFRVDRRTGKGKGMNQGVDIRKWLFMYPQCYYNMVENMERELQFVARGLGIQVDPPEWVELVSIDKQISIGFVAIIDNLKNNVKMHYFKLYIVGTILAFWR